jgi:hypothetical protein
MNQSGPAPRQVDGTRDDVWRFVRLCDQEAQFQDSWTLLPRRWPSRYDEVSIISTPVLERAAYKSGLPPSLPPYRNLGSDALFTCDICLYIPVDTVKLGYIRQGYIGILLISA